MTVMDPALQQLVSVFTQTTSPNPAERKPAEQYLQQASRQPGYALTLLTLLQTEGVELQCKLAAAINFKNHVKGHWSLPEDDLGGTPFVIPDNEKDPIKQGIVALMLSSPPLVQAQTGEALALISTTDFPDNWPNLLPELVSRLDCNDYAVICGVLRTANTIFKRYRFAYRDDRLYTELNYVFELLVGRVSEDPSAPRPLLSILQRTSALIGQATSAEQLSPLMTAVRLIFRIFYSLNSQELPEIFEDTLDGWMSEFMKFLGYENPLLAESDPEKESVVDAVKVAICENINIYIEKNEEEFAKFLQPFVEAVWMLLMKVGTATNTDRLAASAIRFLTTVGKSVHFKLFEGMLTQIVENIVLPNLQVREGDEELFEDNYVEYIRRDIEGSDNDTRRRMACELVKALNNKFPEAITAAVSGHVTRLLAESAASPSNWKAKDCAIYLVVALTVQKSTVAKGATEVSSLVNIGDFFVSHVQPEIAAAPNSSSPFLKADSLKFLTTFRLHIPKATFLQLLSHIAALIGHESSVVHSYAAHCIERMLLVKDNGVVRLLPADVAQHLPVLLQNLFAAFTLGDSNENEYLMKCIMRLTAFMGPEIKPYATECQRKIVELLVEVCKNPRNPTFNHYVFESVAALIKNSCTNDSAVTEVFEGLLFPPFQGILQADVTEFAPYVFQILSQMLELRPSPLPQVYMALFPLLLNKDLWERSGNVPALVRLLQAYLQKAPEVVTEGSNLSATLGVFQKLVASKAHDHQGFYILNTLIEFAPQSTLKPFLPQIWSLLFTRLQNSRTTKFARSLTVFIALFVSKHGLDTVVEGINALQQGLFMMLVEAVAVGALATINGSMETKLCSVGFTKVLCHQTMLAAQPQWSKLFTALIGMLERPAAEQADDDEEDEAGEAPGFATTFAQLHHSSNVDKDPIPEVQDIKAYLAQSLSQLSQGSPGQLPPLITTLEAAVQQALMGYCQAAGVAIS